MANRDTEASALGTSIPASQVTVSAVNAAKFQTIATLRTALLATGYVNAQLDIMSKNDMVYALAKKNSLLPS